MTLIDGLVLLVLVGLVIYNLMLLHRVRDIFKAYPSLFHYPILILLAVMLVIIVAFLLIVTTMILF